jgi:pterin-4a-carbinolamine dehydratase
MSVKIRNVFINYRRLDSEADAGRLMDSLRRKLDGVTLFLDSSSLELGKEWPASIRESLGQASDVIVLIGPNWLRAGSDEFGRRRIDCPDDWVRKEIEEAFRQQKSVLPVLLRQAKMPPPEVLPTSIQRLSSLQALEMRGEYWEHDVRLLIKHLELALDVASEDLDDSTIGPYPRKPTIETVLPVTEEHLNLALSGPLKDWKVRTTPLPEDPSVSRTELVRSYTFREFKDAISFMSMVAPGCDIANHHPRWENIWRTLTVSLTTWNIDHNVSDRDIQLAKYFDSSFIEFVKKKRVD